MMSFIMLLCAFLVNFFVAVSCLKRGRYKMAVASIIAATILLYTLFGVMLYELASLASLVEV